jgi:hypothetical protein
VRKRQRPVAARFFPAARLGLLVGLVIAFLRLALGRDDLGIDDVSPGFPTVPSPQLRSRVPPAPPIPSPPPRPAGQREAQPPRPKIDINVERTRTAGERASPRPGPRMKPDTQPDLLAD